MASWHAYSRMLRTVGQALEERHIDLFDLRCYQDEYLLQCGDPTPPHLSLVELRYTHADLDDRDLNARDNRVGSFELVNFEGLPEILRALGHRVEKRDGRLLRICNSESSGAGGVIQLEYQTRDGERPMWKNSIWRPWKTTLCACLRNARVCQTRVHRGRACF
jgi:hypothetical protein